jgi:ABC-type nitrate/sulfonate/bicarbonate transport system substrate-binding protein
MARGWVLNIAVATSLLAGVGHAYCQQSAKDGVYTFNRATISRAPAEWPLFVADAKGFFAREKIAVKTSLISPSNITGVLIGGAADITLTPAYQLVLSVQKGADLVAIGQGLDPAPYFLMVPASVKSFADLKGKTIAAATPGDVYTVVLKDVLRKGGLDPEKDVKFLYGNNSNQRMAALLNGAIAAGLQLPPQTGMLQERGFHSLAFFPDYMNRLTLSAVGVRKSWAEKNGDHLRAYMRAISAANIWLNDPANKAEAIKLLQEGTKTNEKAASEAYDVFVTKIKNFPKDACIQQEGMKNLVSMLENMGDLAGNPPVTKFIDTQWCPK